MNIFYLDHDTDTCAKYHHNKHVVKMCLEYAQLLSTTHRVLDPNHYNNEFLYKKTHQNHPCAVWARSSSGNYNWLFSMLTSLLNEYSFRYEKIHKTSRLLEYLKYAPANIKEGEFTEPPQCMPDEYKKSNSIDGYREYYRKAKFRTLNKKGELIENTWKNRSIPFFLNPEQKS